jgi:hypothetical protein
MRGLNKINSTTQTFFEIGFSNITIDEKETLRRKVSF